MTSVSRSPQLPMTDRSHHHTGSEAPARTVHPSLHRGAERRDSTDLGEVRRTLWAAADPLRANSTLAPSEYRGPVLGLIFLAYAEHRFDQARPEIEAKAIAHRPDCPGVHARQQPTLRRSRSSHRHHRTARGSCRRGSGRRCADPARGMPAARPTPCAHHAGRTGVPAGRGAARYRHRRWRDAQNATDLVSVGR